MIKGPELIKRIASAALIAPLFLFAIIVSGPLLKLWLFFAFLVSLYEWHGLAKKLEFYYLPVMMWGVIYMAISYSSFLAMREVYSIYVLFMFLGMIWFSDIGAYFVGKFYGGPKLIKKISPNKTWSGFGGALFFPMLFSMSWYLYADLGTVFPADIPLYIGLFISGVLGIVIGCVGQAGDLLVSYIKRMAQVKDTGNLIPGHGGLLDRIDSMLLGAPVFLILVTLLSYVL